MIFGYISTKQSPEIEESLSKENPEANVFEFDLEDRRAFFFQHRPNRFGGLTYQNDNRLLLCDGIPVRRVAGKGYEVVNRLVENDVQNGFASFVDTIISNVNMIYFEKENDDVKLIISSSRAGPGKMYYRSIPGGVAFSTDFISLLKFSPVSWNSDAIYYIVRYGYSPPPLTISKDIRAIPNAHWATIDARGKNFSVWPYFKYDFSQSSGSNLSDVDSVLDLSAKTLDLAGCSLLMSGGIDSTLFAHKMRAHSNRKINAYYLRFGPDDPELPFAVQAAEKTGCSLKIFDLEAEAVPETILEIAESYPHPFNDYSTIATYYLMKCVGNYEPEGVIFDGNGGDDCFGLGLWLPDAARTQRFWFNLPAPIKHIASTFSSRVDLWEKVSGINRLFRAIASRNEKEIYQLPLVLCPWTTIFEADTRKYDTEMGNLVANAFTALLKPLPHNESYLARATIAWMRHVTPGMWCAKTYGIKGLPAVQTVYPYMWKDMLEEQGKVSWETKVHDGIVKWPLKKLLENYMPHDFIYRRKSGFTPPLERWFANKKLYELLCDTLLSQHTVTGRIINKEKLRQLLEKLPNTTQWPMYLGSFLWGSLFTELWVKSAESRQGLPKYQ